MKLLSFFLFVSLVSSQKLGPWMKGKCQRPDTGDCSKPHTCCPQVTGYKLFTRTCDGPGCENEKLSKEVKCLFKCKTESSWGKWTSQGCTPACGKRKESVELFTRSCLDGDKNVVDDSACKRKSRKEKTCGKKLPPCGEWSSWSTVECSVTCGKGTQKSTRTCSEPGSCVGDAVKIEDCQSHSCGAYGDWFTGACSASCGGGKSRSVRICHPIQKLSIDYPPICQGDAKKVEDCNTDACGSGSWSNWAVGTCTKSCGGGTRNILRKCSVPGTCEGSAEITQECNKDSCEPVCASACLNGGICIAPDTCSCSNGYAGDNCADVSFCHSNPCQNGASCAEGDESHLCTCMDGWTGDNCQYKQIPCDGGLQFEGDCFIPISESVSNLDKARAACASLDGNYHLAYLKTTELQQALSNYLRTNFQGIDTTSDYFSIGGSYEWFGLAQQHTSQHLYLSSRLVTWFDGEKTLVRRDDWDSGNPKTSKSLNILLLHVYKQVDGSNNELPKNFPDTRWQFYYPREGIDNLGTEFGGYNNLYPLCQSGEPNVLAEGECMVDGRKGIEVSGFAGQESTYFCVYPWYEIFMRYKSYPNDYVQPNGKVVKVGCSGEPAYIKDKEMQLKISDFLRTDIMLDLQITAKTGDKHYNQGKIDPMLNYIDFFIGGKYVRGSGNTMLWNNGQTTQHEQDEFATGYPKENQGHEYLVLRVHESKESKTQGFAEIYQGAKARAVLCMKSLG